MVVQEQDTRAQRIDVVQDRPAGEQQPIHWFHYFCWIDWTRRGGSESDLRWTAPACAVCGQDCTERGG